MSATQTSPPTIGSSSSPLKVHEVVAATLLGDGTSTVFGLMGDDVAPIAVDLVGLGATHVSARHENQAVAMADAYSSVSGRTGIAIVSGGPGFSNCLTALTTASRTGSRVLLVTSQSKASHKAFPTEKVCEALNIRFVEPSTKEGVLDSVRRAQSLVSHGETCVLQISSGLLHENASDVSEGQTSCDPTPIRAPIQPDPEQIEQIVDLLEFGSSTMRPVILAGAGAIKSGAIQDLVLLADSIGGVLATSLRATCAFSEHPYNLGIAGTYSTPAASGLFRRAECVLAFGASLNKFTTYGGELFGDARFVQVDTDRAALGQFVDVDDELKLHSDAKLAAIAIRTAVESRGLNNPGYRTEANAEAVRAAGQHEIPAGSAMHGPLDPRTLAAEIDAMVPRNRSIVVDGGRHATHSIPIFSAPGPNRIIQMNGAGSIGLGIGAAVGASIARPGAPVVAAVGDASFMMALTDLDTAVRHKCPIAIFVFNDEAWGAEVTYLESVQLDTQMAHIATPDIAAIARAHGAVGLKVDTYGDLDQVRPLIAKRMSGPLVVDCSIESNTPSASLDFLFGKH